MKKLVTTLMLITALGVLWTPAPADATATVRAACLYEAIESCDQDFSGSTEKINRDSWLVLHDTLGHVRVVGLTLALSLADRAAAVGGANPPTGSPG
ncbi:MAG: hypothetical protein HY560_02975 [Gemmatimonadetes bacterium]|nr:hypothetical protein [Gemmatimonadota bacterium]